MEFNLDQFQEDFHEYLAILHKIFIWNAKLHGQNDRSATILFFFYLFPKLTQDEIIEFTHLSRGKVSILLKNMYIQQLINRNFIPGTHKYTYSLRDSKLPFQFSYDDIIKEAEPLIESLKKFIITNLPKSNNTFIQRIQDFLNFYETRQKILIMEKEIITSSDKNSNGQIREEELSHCRYIIFPDREKYQDNANHEIDLKVEPWLNLFKKFIFNLANHSFFMISDFITKQIMACFILEDHLTQTSLMHYTGYSVSTIHRYLKQMMNRGLIKQNSKKFHGQFTYEMEHVILMNTSYETSYKQKMTEDLMTLKKIATDIDHSPNKWVFLPGFPYVYTLLHRVIRFLEEFVMGN